MHRYLLMAGVGYAAILAPPQAARAESAAAGAVEAADPASGDIVVTARRREEKIQKVPLAVSVVNDTALEATGSFNVGKLQQLQPTVQFFSSNPRNSAANIRGLGAPFGLTNDGIEQGVGLYVDQVFYARSAATTFDFLDVQQIEILRGPQGTLYGKNTTAGAINITSRPPSFSPEGRIEVSYGNLGFVQAKAAVSGPLIADRLAIRIAAAGTHRRGTLYNITTGNRINEQDNLGVKAQLLLRATDTLNLTLAGDYNRQNPVCCGQVYVRTGATQRPLNRQYAALAAAFNYAPPSLNPFDRVTDLDGDLKAKQSLGGVSLRAEWELGPGTLTSVSAWRFWNWDPSNDRDFIGLPITAVSANPSKQRQWTQEIRYAGAGGAVDYVFGLFGFHQTVHTSGAQVQGPAASRWLLNPSGVNANDPSVLDGLRSDNAIDFSNTSLAAFGQFTWKLTDRLRVQPGIRVNYDKKSGSYVATVVTGSGSTTLNSDQRGVLAPQSYQPKFSDWNLSYDFTLSYDVAADVMGYATYAKSFKSGGINLSGLPLDAANNPILAVQTVKPESVDHFEVGLKTQFLDRRATLNIAGFWTDVKNFQATVTNGQLGVIRGYLANAAKVRVRGIEADFALRPSDRLSLYANGAFTDAKYAKFVDAPCPPELAGGTAVAAGQTPGAPGTPGGPSPAFCDISGQILPGVSKWALSYGAEYNVPAQVLGQEGNVYLGFDGSYRSIFSSNPSRSAYTDIEGYALSNLRLGFRSASGWDAYGWVRNAFNVKYFDFLSVQSGNTGLIIGQPGDQRTYGLTVKAAF
ncbi:TonB-dependent receptor [Sphingomonas flavalba]|uniref:TonB-dependent receptor n=1 Tax=Sphingomonas flavalba TaxID=2559804 RepID=UPI00109D9C8F|nr:TonB-dependent receptor [Sphingomonas flavalba]